MLDEVKRPKIFIFSDESGSWHDPDDIYVRAWVAVGEDTYNAELTNKVDEIAASMNANELKWSGFSGVQKYFNEFKDINFKLFITISCPSDIDWEQKYNVTRNFKTSVEAFSFGEIDEELVGYLKERMYRDIKCALFLHYYEKFHIVNAKKAIESVILPEEYELIYRVDPPQMSQRGWKEILHKISGEERINLEFPRSERTQGIQFSDLIAGAVRSYFVEDRQKENAAAFLKCLKTKMIFQKSNPNPNLIMYEETNEKVKQSVRSYWKL